MVQLIIAIILLLAAAFAFFFKVNDPYEKRVITCPKIVPVVIIIIALIIGAFGFITTVPTGYTGILTTWGRVENVTLDAGLNLKLPWQKIITMDNREQRSKFEFSAFSADIQQVSVSGSINYSIDKSTAMTLYSQVGTGYAGTLITPRLLEDVKAVFSKYPAEELVAQRDQLSTEICASMREGLKPYGINVATIAIEDIDFTDAFTDAVEAKQVATQNKLKAETEQEQATMVARAEAERKAIEAEAQAEIARIQADAKAYETRTEAEAQAFKVTAEGEAEAEANKKINESLSQQLIEYSYANNWNGKLPSTFIGGENALPLISVDPTVSEENN